MSNYPKWWDTTITIYNKFEDPQTHVIRWIKNIVNGTFWKYVRNKMVVGQETLEVEKTICRIRKDSRFLEKYQWMQLPNYEMQNYFTLSRGDIIIKGEISEDIDEYEKGSRSTDLIEKYKNLTGCIEIESISINVGGGRCLPHYIAEGI